MADYSMTPLQFIKPRPARISETPFDEKWLQDRIYEDPSILGLGELTIIGRERRQSPGGRIDLLLSDPETDMMYEVELMLGRVDESHIIRTIEYWDVERRRWPNREHRAVLVAEEITNRFFNVIGLLNRSVPIIAIQMNAFVVESQLILTFTKVLDIYESPEDEESLAEPTDRSYWERRGSPESMGVFDEYVLLLKESFGGVAPKVTYNKAHIAIGGVRRNFAWLHPRKKHVQVTMMLAPDAREEQIAQLEEAGIAVSLKKKELVGFNLTPLEIKEHRHLIGEVLHAAADIVAGGL